MPQNNPQEALEAIANKHLQDFLIGLQKQFSANLGVAFAQIKDAHDEAFNKALQILQEFDKKAETILHENNMLKTEVETLKKLLQKTNTTTAQVSNSQT